MLMLMLTGLTEPQRNIPTYRNGTKGLPCQEQFINEPTTVSKLMLTYLHLLYFALQHGKPKVPLQLLIDSGRACRLLDGHYSRVDHSDTLGVGRGDLAIECGQLRETPAVLIFSD